MTAASAERNEPSLVLRGALTAIITPFEPGGTVDVAALESLVELTRFANTFANSGRMP